MFTESLTVRILGDSSELRDELESVSGQLDELSSRLSDASRAGEEIGQGLARSAMGVPPLRQVSTLLSQISTQARELSRQPITLNVQPAIAALQQLIAMIAAVAAQLHGLGGGFGAAGGGLFPGVGAPVRGPAPEVLGFSAAPMASQATYSNSTLSQTTNHFGGITIAVTEAVEINDVIRDLRLHGAALRQRRG